MYGIATDTGPGPYISVSFGHPHFTLIRVIRLTADQTNVEVEVNDNWTDYDTAYVIIEYTRDP